MKSKAQIVLMFERRIEVDGAMVSTPFVKLRFVDDDSAHIEGEMHFAVRGGKVEYAPEKVDLREVNGQLVRHVVIAEGALVASITGPDGTVYKADAVVDVTVGV